MSPAKSLKYMDSMMNAWENMEMLMFGKYSLISSIIYHWRQSYKIKYSAFMVVFHQVLILSIK